jgi:hypothetical protein
MKKAAVVGWGIPVLVALGLAIQLVPVPHDNPPVLSDIGAPPDVQAVLKTSCYDCHSRETTWPWYSRVAPISWLVARDVISGRRHLDFSNWNQYPADRKSRKFTGIVREVGKGDMPPWYYTIKHGEARLSQAQKQLLVDWANRSK